ncbi:hypothetical protein [Zwartia panacis]|jgi:hypothetical protein|uniref:hypothetical protein n=1 Tax=Zwartia panacis TaxID=2683345 RepID=UPI0025B5C4F1|nr:hypothetical protein [Zwartia panacis]MDN4017892.1 hypothetical protein [Zwartia panacis]
MKKNTFYAAIACLAIALASTAQAKQTFSIVQSKPEIQHIDIGTPGMSIGDLLAFEAPFTTKDGKKGRMYGMITLVSLPTGAHDPFLDRISTIVLDFGGSDSLVINGKSVYGEYHGEMKENAPQVRAITGGTGKFIGARGQISTSRHAAGTYEHVIELLD